MRYLFFSFILIVIISCGSSDKKILVFSKTAGFRHESIKDGIKAIQKLGVENGFKVDSTEDAGKFTEENLKQYSAVVFLSTTGTILDSYQKNAFERYVQSGGGFAGIHAATDTEYHWPWYNKLVGAYFASHPAIQDAKLEVVDNTHPSTKHLPKEWKRKDEWYNFKSIHPLTKKLLTIDESSYQGGSNGKDHPMSWYHEYEGGRAWYTALGHTKESYAEDNFLKHLLGGIQYAIGNNKRNLSKAKTPRKPEANRFTLDKIIEGQLFEPTEMTILPNSDVVIVQRRGEIIKYDNATKKVKQIGYIPVYHSTSKSENAEEGLMGVQKDPKFEKNGFIYLFYAVVDSAVNRLSRFYMDKDSVHMKSEKAILDVASTRQICCHTGGSIAFSGDGQYLFLSTGDNATPFDEEGEKYVNEGYGPQDNRKGHEQYDARRSSANTNDLRGKILKIKLNVDGSYSIPEGNLFPKGMGKTRPEIFVMGNRNPYRISVDPKNNYLYWGEVGPDAAEDKEGRGPRGYDEVNVAKKAGNYGWPLFVGNNYPYNKYDYATGKSGPLHDPSKPMNESINNTGLIELPPAQPAMIYYPYAKSDEFPELTDGGRNAMAGPVYYTDLYPANTRLPDYFNGKLLIYDWIRQWIKIVHVDKDNFIEPFLDDYSFSNIIDMEVGPTGELYLLEYGKGWFSKNSDAGLSKVVYNEGNRVPKVKEIVVDKLAGQAPHTFTATIDAKDPDNDALTYQWQIDQEVIETKEPKLTHTIKDIKYVQLSCTVVDPSGNKVSTKKVAINSGNKIPEIAIKLEGNQSIYFPGEKIKYAIDVKDDNTFDLNNVFVKNNMTNWDENSLGHLIGGGTSVGEGLIASSDCQSCHKKDTTSIGPSYVNIAKRYEGKDYARNYLAEKIRIGGSGNWGEGAMAAHPAISENQAFQIVDWILALSDKAKIEKSLPLSGIVSTKVNPKELWNNVAALTVSYTDKPTNGAKPLTNSQAILLRPNFINADQLSDKNEFKSIKVGKSNFKILPQNTGYIDLKKYDLSGVNQLTLVISGENKSSKPYRLILVEKENKQIIGSINAKPGKVSIPIGINTSAIKDYMLTCEGPGDNASNLILEKLIFEK